MHDLDHERYMRSAVELARTPEPLALFRTVIVDRPTGKIVAEGANHSDESPIWHGETDAIHRCATEHPDVDWSQLVLYTTAEPCAMCQAAIGWAGIAMVVYGASTPFLQSLGWNLIDIRAEELARRTPFNRCEVIGGVLEAECNAIFEEYARSHPEDVSDR